MKRRPSSFKIILLVITWLLLPVFIIFTYLQEKEEIQRIASIALGHTIDRDYQSRHDQELKYSEGLLGRKLKGAHITNEHGTETVEFKDSVEEEKAMRMIVQYVLADVHPIQPDSFNLLFHEELHKYGIDAETGIIYSYKGNKQYSGNDSISPQQAPMFVTPLYKLDIKQVVGIQMWMRITWVMVLQNIDLNVALGLIAYFITLIWFTFSAFKDEEEDENIIHIGNLLINKEAEKAYIGETDLKLPKRLYRLLLLFAQKKGHTLTRKEIWDEYYESQDNKTNNILNMISTLRGYLVTYPEYQLITNKDGSWTLVLPKS